MKMTQLLKGKNLPVPKSSINLNQNPSGKLTLKDIIGPGNRFKDQRLYNQVQGKP